MLPKGEAEGEGGPSHRGSRRGGAEEHTLPPLGWPLGGQDREGVSTGKKGLGWGWAVGGCCLEGLLG